MEENYLENRISKDYQRALKEGRKIEISILRLIRSELKNRAIEKQNRLSEEDIINVLRSLLKKEREALQFFIQGNREKLIEKTKEEITIIENYLPADLSLAEIEKIAREVIVNNNIDNKKGINLACKFIMSKIKGRADGKVVKDIVSKILDNGGS